jgi:tellurite resistance protein
MDLSAHAQLSGKEALKIDSVDGRNSRYFAYLPVSLFASVMGLSGLGAAWRLAADRYGLSVLVSEGLGLLAVCVFIALASAYLVKAISAPDAVRAEFVHPIAGNFFGTILVSMLLLPVQLAPVSLTCARAVWIVGTVGMFGFAWLIVNRWMRGGQQVRNATPAWIIPVVGLLDIPLAVPSLMLAPADSLTTPCVAIGMFFAIPIFTIIFSRSLFEEPLPPALQPTLMILVAPFAVGFSAYVMTTGHVDRFATGLYGLMLFVLAILLGRLRSLARCCPFRVAWWAVSFPLAACAGAAVRFAAAQPGPVPDAIALFLLSFSSVVIAGLSIRTILGIVRGELRSLSG